MKRFLAFVLIATLGLFTFGCDSKKGTTQKKSETTTRQTEDGRITGETTTSTEVKTKATRPSDGDMTTEKTTETTESTQTVK